MSTDNAPLHAVQTVQVAYQATAAECREALRVLTKSSPAARRSRWIVVGIGLMCAVQGVRIDSQGGAVMWPPVLIGVVFVAFFLGLAPRLRARQVHRDSQARGMRYLTVDGWGVTAATEHERQWSAWARFSRHRETPTLFVLLSADHKCMTFLPKRAFHEPGDADRLRQLLTQHLPPTPWAAPAQSAQ
ncbi:YcxB family protein [Streptomyces sp. NPDC059070]|uniref:YcxB family protein n=1 Tax=Streptomyces sp. NPDC059070 TaxID=3346713 RepID=UPI003697E691